MSTTPLKVRGSFYSKLTYKDKALMQKFYVVEENYGSLLGKDSAKRINLLRFWSRELFPIKGPVYTGPVPDWIQIGFAFTRDLLEPGTMWVHLPGTMWVHLRKGPSTDLDRSRSRVNGQDRSHYGSVSLSMLSNRNVYAVATFYSSLISA